MGKFISNLFLGVLAVGLSIFTASRTLDLLTWALPAGQTIYTWLGLAAFEGGMYFWAFFFISGAKGTPQRSISLLMAVFSVIAVCVATVVDLSLGASEAGKLPALSPSVQQSMIIFVGIVIALNVAAFLACHLMAPEKLREIKSGQAEDRIFAEGLRAIEALAPTMAAEAAPHLAADWATRTWQQIVPGVPRRTEYLGPAPAAVPALPAGSPEPLPLQSPTRPAPAQPAPVVPSQAPAKPRKLLGFIPLGGGSGESAPATLAQTGTVEAPAPAPAPVVVPASAPAPARRPVPVPASQVAAARRARRAARFHRSQATAAAPAPAAEPIPAPDEHRTCSECGAVLDLKNAKQLTCSPACRTARARRLAAERQARKR
jgi:hypothetical protein